MYFEKTWKNEKMVNINNTQIHNVYVVKSSYGVYFDFRNNVWGTTALTSNSFTHDAEYAKYIQKTCPEANVLKFNLKEQKGISNA